ncbi:MAG: hypothetical protein C0478_10805 [Planctomyces sp.]|nr:hypothetical protein [Planctomyces sp.]
MFHRSTTDQSFTPLDLRDFYAAPEGAACWLMGGGPSLTRLPLAEIRASHIPIMAVNLAGQGHLIPDFWTAYDPTARFLPSIYRSPRTLKFLHRRRSMDLLPGGTHKLCECPGLVFFENEKRDFTHAFSPQANKILDWNDSLIQAIDILFHLGFRTLYLAGCELSIAPATAFIEHAAREGLEHHPGQPLRHFLEQCKSRQIAPELSPNEVTGPQYHFDEAKPLAATLRTDEHYQRTVQLLRLSRKSLTQAGLRLVSVTPDSRLNDYFHYQPVAEVLTTLAAAAGSPELHRTRGLYTGQPLPPPPLRCPMRDLKAPTP